MTSTFRIRAGGAERLDEILRREIPARLGRGVSNAKIRRLIVAGAVRVDGAQVRIPGFVPHRGADIAATVDESRLFFEKAPDDIAFELTARDVLFEDESIIVVNKPAFFPTEAGMVGSRDNLHAAVVRYLHGRNPTLRNPPYAGVMHRLDRETSGVVLFTKARAVNAPCHAMFEQHFAHKVYRAIVCAADSKPVPPRFSVEMEMGRVSAKSQAARWGRVAGGVPSRTDFAVLGEWCMGGVLGAHGACVLVVECRPHTGRTHQIRVHAASVGLPILGDTLYGGRAHTRIMLHALLLTFPHPVTGAEMTVSAPLPADFLFPSEDALPAENAR